jgi:O-antigen/teichoic acid export membrane protein
MEIHLNRKKLFKDYAYNLSRTILNIGAPLIVLPFVMNRIGPENYGVFSYVNSIISYFTMLAILGIPDYASRAIARIQDDIKALNKTCSEIFVIQSISVSTALGIFFLGFYPYFTGEYKMVFLILSILIFGNYFNTEWYYIGRQNFRFIANRSNFLKILNILAILFFIKQGDNSYKYSLIVALTSLMNAVITTIGIIPHLSFKNLSLKPHFRPIIILFSLSVASLINSNIDKTLTGYLVGPLYVGYYAIGFRLTHVIMQVFKAMNNIIFPRVTASTAKNDYKETLKLIQFNADYILMLSAPILLGIALYGREILILMFGKELEPAYLSLVILIGTIPALTLLNVVRRHILLPRDKEKVLIFIWVAMTIMNIVLNLLLVPQYKHIGAAFATMLAEVSGMLFGLYYSKKHFGIDIAYWGQFKYLFATPVLIIPYCLRYLAPHAVNNPIIMLLQISLSIPLYFLCLYFLKDRVFYKQIKRIRKKRI